MLILVLIPKRVNLVQLLDVKEKKITTIQADLTKLKLEKECVSITIKQEAKNLEYATQVHKALLSYSTGVEGHLECLPLTPLCTMNTRPLNHLFCQSTLVLFVTACSIVATLLWLIANVRIMHCDWGSACNYLQDAKIPHVM
jgi:hypothetical protein